MTRTAKIIGITIGFYVAVFCNPLQFAIADLMHPPAANNAYSPYTMYERCHPEKFHISPHEHC